MRRLLLPETVLPLTALVLVLAFFLGSSTANNSDLWLHLATGRALVEGGYQFGVEPFTYANGDAYWVNPSWLYDLLLYVLSQTLGFPALVVIKAGSMALLAAIILASGWTREESRWFALIAAALGLVAIGPWMALKPSSVSFLFLAITGRYLDRRICGSRERTPTFLSSLPLLLLFALWANLDAWFFLGPLLVLLYFAGEMLDRTRSSALEDGMHSSTSWGFWIWLLAGSLAACVLNPHHVRIYQVPIETVFSETRAALAEDPYLRSQVLTPFGNVYFSQAVWGAPGIAFWLLACVSLVLLFLDFSFWPWRWRLSWAAFFGFSLWQVQGIPFFAIVASAITARALGHYASTWGGARSWGWTRFLRGAACLGILLLPAAAWTGWLQLDSAGPRRWRVNLDLGLVETATRLSALREKGILGGGRGFFFSPETANYFAWLLPAEKSFVNSHFHLTPALAADFVAVRQGLAGHKTFGSQGWGWRRICRENHVNHLVIHSNDLGSTVIVTSTLLAAYKECPLLFFRGRTTVFGWRDPDLRPETPAGSPDRLTGGEITLAQLAFARAPGDRVVPEMSASPAGEARPFLWWDAFWRPRTEFSVERDEAAMLIRAFDAVQEVTFERNEARGKALFFTGLLAEAMGNRAWACTGRIGAAVPWQDAFVQSQDNGPLENLYLAIRAARRAVRDHPNDAEAFLLLGEAYSRLLRQTRERVWCVEFPRLAEIRAVQLLSAFQHAADLNPDSPNIHKHLAQFYASLEYNDLALEHLKRALALGRKSRRAAEENRSMETGIARLKKNVDDALDRYDHIAHNLRVEERAFLGKRHGLAGKALEVLLASELAAFGRKGLRMELDLLLNTGRSDKVLAWLTPELEPDLGPPTYHWIKAQAEAALGEYPECDRDLASVVTAGLPPIPGGTLKKPVELALLALANTLLAETAGGPLRVLAFPTLSGFPLLEQLPPRLEFALQFMHTEASMTVLRGILALESGAVSEAHTHFRAASAFWTSPAGRGYVDPGSRMCRRICAFFLEQAAR